MILRIESPGLAPLALDDPAAGLYVSAYDLGAPRTREVMSPRPLADGADDFTQYVGERVVSMTVDVFDGDGGTHGELVDLLAAFCHPGRRSTIYESHRNAERQVQVRAGSTSAPRDHPTDRAIQVAFVAPSGLIESATVSTVTVPPLPAAEGAPFDWTFPVSWPPAAPDATVATSAGSMGAWPTIRVDGPCFGPVIANGSRALAFPELAIDAGHFVEIDTAARTVLLDGVTDRRSSLDPASSTWWQITPGANELTYAPELSGPPSEVTVTWRAAYFL